MSGKFNEFPKTGPLNLHGFQIRKPHIHVLNLCILTRSLRLLFKTFCELVIVSLKTPKKQ